MANDKLKQMFFHKYEKNNFLSNLIYKLSFNLDIKSRYAMKSMMMLSSVYQPSKL